MGYETKWKSQTVRKAASASHNHAAFRQTISHSGSKGESLSEFGGTMASELSKDGPKRNSEPGQMGTAIPLDRSSEREAKEKATARSWCNRIRHRLMDVKTYCASDSGRLRSPIYARGGVETVTQRFWLELPKAGTTRSSKRRKSHCTLEKQDMASYKKKPKDLGPILPFWTKAGFCSYRTFVKLGHLRAAHRSFVIATGVIGSRSSEVSPYLLVVNTWVFMSVFMPITSPERKSLLFCGICCIICAGMLFWSGTVGLSTKGQTSKFSWKRPSVFMSIDFLAMPRKLIRLNMFGLMENAICPTVCMKTRFTWGLICIVPSVEYAVLSNFLNLAFNTRNSLGHELCMNNNVSIIS